MEEETVELVEEQTLSPVSYLLLKRLTVHLKLIVVILLIQVNGG